MTTQLAQTGTTELAGHADTSQQFVSVMIAKQTFGVPVLLVQDILGPQRITRIPLSPPEIAGALNLRGRIVTVVDVRKRLNLPPMEAGKSEMNVVVDHEGELYSLMVDGVGEVLNLPYHLYERSPANLAQHWRDISDGVYRLDDKLLLMLDVKRLLDFS